MAGSRPGRRCREVTHSACPGPPAPPSQTVGRDFRFLFQEKKGVDHSYSTPQACTPILSPRIKPFSCKLAFEGGEGWRDPTPTPTGNKLASPRGAGTRSAGPGSCRCRAGRPRGAAPGPGGPVARAASPSAEPRAPLPPSLCGLRFPDSQGASRATCGARRTHTLGPDGPGQAGGQPGSRPGAPAAEAAWPRAGSLFTGEEGRGGRKRVGGRESAPLSSRVRCGRGGTPEGTSEASLGEETQKRPRPRPERLWWAFPGAPRCEFQGWDSGAIKPASLPLRSGF